MPIPKPNLVRLFAAVLGSAAIMWFVEAYSGYARIRFDIEHQYGNLIDYNQLYFRYGQWLFLYPVLALAVGLWLLRFRPHASVSFEILLSLVWLISLALVALCLVAWQAQNIPTFSHMELHY